jgi:D-alanine-D-alanine ligase
MAQKKKIGILMGGGVETFLSVQTARTVFNLLDRSRFEVTPIIWKDEYTWYQCCPESLDSVETTYSSLVDLLANASISCIFLCLHGEMEADGRLIGLLEFCKRHYTGNSFLACVTGQNKYFSKLIFEKMGCPTTEYVLITQDFRNELFSKKEFIEKQISFPCVLKPTSSGSSKDLMLVDSFDALHAVVPSLMKRNKALLLEQYVSGQEVSVGVFGRYYDRSLTVLPPATIQFDEVCFDFEHKCQAEYEVVIPARISKSMERKLRDMAAGIHRKMGFEALSRTDFIVNGEDIYVLETNINPGLSRHSIFPKMVAAAGLSLKDILNRMIDWAFDRQSFISTEALIPMMHTAAN